MKRFLALAALVLGLASCQTEPEGLDVNVGGAVDTTITVSIPETETRYGENSNSAGSVFTNGVLSADDVTMRYIFQVYYNNGDQIVESQAAPQVKYSDDKSVNFGVRLVPDRDYTFVVWADVVEMDEDGNWADLHYNTSNDEGKITLNNITVNEDKWVAMDESRDAFTVTKVIEGYTGTSEINLELKRPLAKLRVKTTDMKVLKDLQIKPTYATVVYTSDLYNTFNAVDGTVSGAMSVGQIGYEIAAYSDNDSEGDEQSMILFTDYVFAPKDQDGAVRFDLTVYDEYGTNDDVNRIKYNSFSTDIKTHRNYLTTISGNVLTDGNNIKVEVKDAFVNVDNNGNTTDPNFEYKTISSDKEFLAAVNTPGKYVVISDLHLAKEGDTMTTLATRAGGTTTIDLNGKTITVENKGNGALASVAAGNTLVITNTVDGGKIELTEGSNGAFIENNGTVVIEGGEFSSETGATATVINNNGEAKINGGILEAGAITNNGTTNVEDGVINEGAIVNTTNGTTEITGGEFTYNPSDDVPEGFEAKEENGKYIVTECEPVAKIGDVEYTTIKATFEAVENGQTIILQRNVETKSTAVLTEGKTVILNLNGKTLSATDKNVIRNDGGNLTIKNGTITRTGDVVGYSVNNASGEITVENATITRGLYTSGSKMTATNANISHEQSSRHAIYAWNCEVTINSGTYHNDNAGNATLMASGSSVVTINGGTFSIADGRETLSWTSCLMDQNGTAKITVKGGKFNGGFRINSADTTLTIEGGEFNTNNGSGYTYYNGTVTVKGGTYTDNAAIAFAEKYVAEGYVLDGDTVVLDVKVAKVGDTEYRKIDDAIANWTNNTTLTLLADVTLSDVISIKSTEYRVLDLGTYTMTAASKKDAITITAEGRTSASYALDIKADATNPGGITATSKAVVKTTGKSGVKDRPIIRFYNGVYNASNVISHSGSNGTNCPQFQFHNGVYNANLSTNRALIQIYGGTFNGRFYTSVDSSAYMLISGGKFKYLDNLYGSALNEEKFTIGSSKGNFNRGVYVDDEGYFVVGGEVITEFGDMFAAKATNVSKAGTYLPYSSAAEHGLYYTNADMAISKHGEANVVLK